MNPDARRVAAIAAYDVLDRDPRADLVATVELAARLCGTPMATINLITDTEQHQVAAYGFERSVCMRSDSMCAKVFDGPTPVVVADARLDPRFADNPFVTGEIGRVRLYASHTLRTPEDVAIGTLCVFGEEARELDDEQTRGLSLLAGRVVDALELWLRSRELVASNARLQAIASQVSHDLKTPLATMSLSLGLIGESLERVPEAERARPLLARSVAAAERMSTYIDRHLEAASVTGGLRHGPVDLRVVVDEVILDLESRLHGVEVTVQDLPVVTGDAAQLRAVVQNLIDNAAKFRHDLREPEVTVRATPLEEGWRIEVVDNGSGLPEGERSRVFEAGVRAHDRVEGTGLGLDTARRATEAHGGRIGLEAAVGGGTVAWFELPR